MNEKITITTEKGNQISADIICYLENTVSGKKYLYYTLNEITGTGTNSTVKIYVSKILQNNPTLDTPITEEEWNELKGHMGEALKGAVNNTVKYLPPSELVNAVSVSDRAIAMPTNYDYINKQRGIYAQAVASMSEPVNKVVTPEPIEEPKTQTLNEAINASVETSTASNEPISAQQANVTPNVAETNNITPVNASANVNLTFKPLDANELEQKYAEMIEYINKLKEMELDAIKRYNATIELSNMHNEQHANYVANEQIKENTQNVNNMTPKEPEPVTPIVPEPAKEPASSSDIETNWFDMPNNTAA